MASDGRYSYYTYSYPTAQSYEPQRPIRSDSGSSSSQPPHSPHQQPQQQFTNQNHNPPQTSYAAPSQQHYAPSYMSPQTPQQWSSGPWVQQSYAPAPPETQQFNSVPPPQPPPRPPSPEPQRIWNHTSYAPPPPPPPLEAHHYSSPPARPRSDEPQQRMYALPPPPPSPPSARQSHVTPSQSHQSYHHQSQPQHAHHQPPHPNPTPPEPEQPRSRRRKPSTPIPPPEPEYTTPYPSSPTPNSIDFLKLVDSYRVIMEAGKALSQPRAGAMDLMLENAFYGAQVLEGASATVGGHSHHHQQHPHPQQRQQPQYPSQAKPHASPVAVQRILPPHQQSQVQPQLQRVHSTSTVSSSSDNGRTLNHPQPLARSPPKSARPTDRSPRDVMAQMKARPPVDSKVSVRGSGSDAASAVISSPSKPQSQKSADSGSVSAGADSGPAQESSHGGGTQKCLGCGATATPEWRRGPLGPRTLCNACGLVYAKLVKKRLHEEVRAGGGRAANGQQSRGGPALREESPEVESEDEDEEYQR